MAREITTWQAFQDEVDQRAKALCAQLPQHVSRDRFMAAAIEAVKQNPDLLRCTPRSLMAAVTKAAQDGLIPDGRREGVILNYKGEAQWIPMVGGLRKRARELDYIIVSAEVIYSNDHFIWRQGDDPHIEHIPAQLGTPRGEMIGAYAIFWKGGDVLHREVMDADEIGQARAMSKQPNGLMWTKFTGEAWKKTVVRRGFKSVPCSESLDSILRHSDEEFDFNQKPEPRVVQARRAPPPLVGTVDQNGDPRSHDDPRPNRLWVLDRGAFGIFGYDKTPEGTLEYVQACGQHIRDLSDEDAKAFWDTYRPWFAEILEGARGKNADLEQATDALITFGDGITAREAG